MSQTVFVRSVNVGRKMMRCLSAILPLFALICVLNSERGILNAQSFNAQITGTVKDPSGAVVPGVRLTATNLAT